MKVKALALAASVAGFGLAGAAQGDVIVTFAGPNVLAGHQTVSTVLNNVTGTVTGISVSFTYTGVGASWASDGGVIVGDYQWGVYNNSNANLLLGATNKVVAIIPGLPSSSSQGAINLAVSGSSLLPGGTYAGESVLVAFGNTWQPSGGSTWTDIVITIHGVNVPAPGALALLGLAGVTGVRRRRRA